MASQVSLNQEALVAQCMPTVRFIAARFHDRLPSHIEMDDLVSAGTLGLLDAIERFDPERGVGFNSYAQFRIRGAILDSLRETDWASRSQRKRGREIQESVQRLSQKLGRFAEEQELADDLGIPLLQLQKTLGDLKGLEFESLFSNELDSGELNDMTDSIPDNRPIASEMVERDEQKRLLAKWIGELPERERQVLSLYYVEELPMKEIAKLLGVVESRVSQIHTSAIFHLRSMRRGVQ